MEPFSKRWKGRGKGRRGHPGGSVQVPIMPAIAGTPSFSTGQRPLPTKYGNRLNRKAPDTLVLPIGHGTLFLGVYIGFKELKEAGLIKKIPKLVGVQSASCAPLYQAFQEGKEEVPPIEKKETMAEGIAIAKPVRGKQILKAVHETGGEILAVHEEEIWPGHEGDGSKGPFH